MPVMRRIRTQHFSTPPIVPSFDPCARSRTIELSGRRGDHRVDGCRTLSTPPAAELFSLRGKVVIVTGGTSGISSIAGLRGNRVLGSYGITKAANAQLVRNLAVQWGAEGIRVNAIAPGVIETAFATPITADPAAASARLAKTPLGRFGTPAEVAGTALWLASDAGAFVTGQTIVVDGGTLIAD